MKRKTFVFSLFGITGILLAVGLFSENIIITKVAMAAAPLVLLFAVSYMVSLIPAEHRSVDMDAEMKLTELTEVK